jgi:hypothetical protein
MLNVLWAFTLLSAANTQASAEIGFSSIPDKRADAFVRHCGQSGITNDHCVCMLEGLVQTKEGAALVESTALHYLGSKSKREIRNVMQRHGVSDAEWEAYAVPGRGATQAVAKRCS